MEQMAVSGRFLPQWGPGLCSQKPSPGLAALCVGLRGLGIESCWGSGSSHLPVGAPCLEQLHPCHSLDKRSLRPALCQAAPCFRLSPGGSSRLDFAAGGPRQETGHRALHPRRWPRRGLCPCKSVN